MTTTRRYFVIAGGRLVACVRTLDQLAAVWAEQLDDPTASLCACPPLTQPQRDQLAELVMCWLLRSQP
jgi:hypothetical protein